MSLSKKEHPKSISLAPYPEPGAAIDARKVEEFRLIQRIVEDARKVRADNKVDPKLEVAGTLHLRDKLLAQSELAVIAQLARLNIQQQQSHIESPFMLKLALESRPNGASRARLEKENMRLERTIDSQSRQLSDEAFVAKAPPHVIDGMRTKLAEYQAQLKKNRDLLDNL
jgi:valyl-tRNA synthetase